MTPAIATMRSYQLLKDRVLLACVRNKKKSQTKIALKLDVQ